jgi:PAS domain S-box-containing protein
MSAVVMSQAAPLASDDSSNPRVPSPGPAAANTGVEARLKLIVESAPVSLILAGPEGRILAANRAALASFAMERPDQVVGHTFDRYVAPEDRARVAAFVADVCSGQSGSLEYDLIDQNGTRRTLETRAVPLRRESTAVAAFLGATWDVTDRRRQLAVPAAASVNAPHHATRAAELEALERALQDARDSSEAMARNWDGERQALGEAFRQTRQRMQTALSQAEEQHERLARDWNLERETLSDSLRLAEEREAVLASELIALRERRARDEMQLLDYRQQQADLERTARELEDRCARLSEDRLAERQLREDVISRYEVLANEHEQWQANLADISRLLQEASARAAGLPQARENDASQAGDSDPTQTEETSWQF